MHTRPTSTAGRRGATAVEFAIVAPLLFMLVMAGIEFSRANLLRHTCKIAAVEGARKGIVPGATADDCLQAAGAELAILGVQQSTVEVQPNPIARTDDTVTVTVRVPAVAANGFAVPQFFLGKTMSSTVTLSRETASTTYELPDEGSSGGDGGNNDNSNHWDPFGSGWDPFGSGGSGGWDPFGSWP